MPRCAFCCIDALVPSTCLSSIDNSHLSYRPTVVCALPCLADCGAVAGGRWPVAWARAAAPRRVHLDVMVRADISIATGLQP